MVPTSQVLDAPYIKTNSLFGSILAVIVIHV